MAQELIDQDHTFPEPPPSYPWDRWGNGSLWTLTPGVDFRVEERAFRRCARQYAWRNGQRRVQFDRDSSGNLLMRFYRPPTTEEPTTP